MGGPSVWLMPVGIPAHRDGHTAAHGGHSAGRGKGRGCLYAEEIGGVPLFVRFLCTCPKESRGLCGKRVTKQLVSSPPCSLLPSHSLALFSSSAPSHKKTFLQLFFLSLCPRLLPPLPSCLLFPFFFSPVVVNLSARSLPSPGHRLSYFS